MLFIYFYYIFTYYLIWNSIKSFFKYQTCLFNIHGCLLWRILARGLPLKNSIRIPGNLARHMADNFKSNFITVKPPLEMHFPFCLLADLAQLFPSFPLLSPLPSPLLLSVSFFGSNACIWNINREFHILSLSPPRCCKICTMKGQSETAREGKVGEESVQLARLTEHAYLPHRN